MKTYKVKIAWEGVKVGEILETKNDGFNYINPAGLSKFNIAIALHLGFIEEVGQNVECKKCGLLKGTVTSTKHKCLKKEEHEFDDVVKKEKFVPKVGDDYWYVHFTGDVVDTTHLDAHSDDECISIGNCYRTEAEALEARERVLKAY